MQRVARQARAATRNAVGFAMVTVVALALIAGGVGTVWSQRMMGSGGMREMMRGMMQGQVPPPGMTPEALPEPDSAGAHLLTRYCTQCHDLPSPRYKTGEQWPTVFDRRLGRMRMMSGGKMGGGMMGMGRREAPGATEARTLLDYILDHAMVPATPEQLARGPADARAVFQSQCSRCHALPSPSMHAPERWPGIVARMQANMQLMGKITLTGEQQASVVRFLQTASRGAAN